jgi:hypothetical protein
MDISTKLGYAAKSIESITRHDDENSAVRLEAINLLRGKLDAEEASIRERDAARVSTLEIKDLNPTPSKK